MSIKLKTLTNVACLLIFFGSTNTFAALVTSGFSSTNFFRDCALTTCANISQLPTAFFTNYSTIGPATLENTHSLGTARGVSSPTGDVFSPELKAFASSISDQPPFNGTTVSRVSAETTAIQRFENTGPTAIQIQLTGSVDWTITPGAAPSPAESRLFYRLTLFETISGFLDVDLTSDFNSRNDLNTHFNPANVDGTVFFNTFNNAFESGNVNLASELVTLNPGEGIFVGAQLIARGVNGGITDAFSTFSTSILDENGNVLDESSGLSPVSVIVNEPSTISLLILSLLGLRLSRKK